MSSADIKEEQRSARPRRKIDQIVRAATRLFMENGYAATSMDSVAREASVSKATLYVYFTNKEALFASIVETSGEHYTSPLIAGESGNEEIRTKLLRFGRTILELLLAPETIASYRMVMAEAARSPELGRIFYENGAARLIDKLEQFFTGAMKTGTLRRAHTRRAAEQFIGLIRGDLQFCALLGVDKEISATQQDLIVKSGVDTFYRAYQPAREGHRP